MVSRGTRDHNIIALLDISRAVTMNPLWMQDSNHLSRFSRFFGFLFIGFWVGCFLRSWPSCASAECAKCVSAVFSRFLRRSEEHTSELQSQFHLVCRLLL